jgi:hypothetical protein
MLDSNQNMLRPSSPSFYFTFFYAAYYFLAFDKKNAFG